MPGTPCSDGVIKTFGKHVGKSHRGTVCVCTDAMLVGCSVLDFVVVIVVDPIMVTIATVIPVPVNQALVCAESNPFIIAIIIAFLK